MAAYNPKESKFTVMFNSGGEHGNKPYDVITKKLDSNGDKSFIWSNYINNVFIISCYENSTWTLATLTDEIRKFTTIPFMVTEIKDGEIQGWVNPKFWKWWTIQRDLTKYKLECERKTLESERRNKLLKIKKKFNDKNAEKIRLANLVIREKELAEKKKILAEKKAKKALELSIKLAEEKRIENIRLEELRVERELNELDKNTLNNKYDNEKIVDEKIVDEKISFWRKYFNF